MSSRTPRPENPNPDYQDRDIKLKPLMVGLVMVAVVVAGTFAGMAALLSHYRKQANETYQPVSPLATDRELPPGPLLQVAPRVELEAHRAIERLFLDRYQWIDQEADLARIPIDRAMAILAEQGLPVRRTDHD